MTTVYVNGKFSAQPTTGVQRVATRLLCALDEQVAPGALVLLHPPAGRPPVLRRIETRALAGPRRLHLWEQLALPWAARDGLLLNLSGSAPALARRQMALLHDAAVFDHPEAYTRPFVAWYRWLFRRLGRRAEGLFTVSEFSRGRLAACLGVAPERFTRLTNGCDHLDTVVPDDTVLDRHALRGQRCVLAVASANPTKNLAALVAAFARLRPDPALRLVIVGGGNERVFAGAGAAADPPGVVRTGPLTDAPLKALYRHAAIFVFPSLYEGFGIPPLEAMRCGCPVAASNAASIPEVCADAALYFDPRRVETMAAVLQRLLDDAALCERLRDAGRVRAAGFGWAAAAAPLRAALAGAAA